MKKQKKGTFDNFTNLYSLSRTLRFELKPVGKTLENMRKHLMYDKDLQTFLKDQEIEDAYQTLKTLFDALHEEFITDSLMSNAAKNIDFSEYLANYKENKELKKTENDLRKKFNMAFQEAGEKWKKEKYTKYGWKKGKEVASGANILSCQDLLHLIKDKFPDYANIKEIVDETFKGFFTYFAGFNQNRENYYETKEEKATAVATRIVYENLPKFCDNLIQFECITKKKKNGAIEKTERKSEYLNAYKYLKDNRKTTQIKDAKSGKMIEASVISEDIFKISHFPSCLSQDGIEEYNRIIGHYNLLINLYNQAKREEEKDLEKNKKIFKDLPKFKTLWKQIGFGKKDSLFFALTHDTKAQALENKEKKKKPYSVEQILEQAKSAGEKYFRGKNDDGVIKTVPEFLEYILEKENYDGAYWSKAAMNTISNKYFANYHELKDRLKEAKVFQKPNKGSEEDIKIPEAIELSGLFAVLDTTADWQATLFKKSILEDEKKVKIIQETKTPSKTLLKMIFGDIEDNAKQFLDFADTVLGLKDYKSKEGKEIIKQWMDYALAISQMLNYFLVKESKAKGLDSEVSNALKAILFEATLEDRTEIDWFRWYDALRNYLTKKPQDDAKENKLKLNFENGSLLGGWSDGQEKNKASVILKKDGLYYLGILKKKNIFDTEKQDNEIYQNTTPNTGRLILANLKFQTLAGKGFLGEFGKSYGDIGKEDPKKAIKYLQKIINDRYIKKYPLLERIANTSYMDKKSFDKDIQETLKKCYVCEFKPTNWKKAEEHSSNGEMYLFQIYSKDIAEKSTGNKNMQTLYWDIVFDENSPFQLNGGGEIFYRKQVIEEKKVKIGYEKKPWVIENKRFTEEDGKFFFHCPIKLNYKATGASKPKYALYEVNNFINEHIPSFPNLHFLGIDRGEKHLVYFCLIDQNGKIVDQGSLNLPFTDKDGNPRSIKKEKYFYDKKKEKWESKVVDCWNYNDLLDAMASNRDMARKNWQTIGTIKELKAGYISQVVRKIADLATAEDKPAFITLEDLNTGFKRGRQKIEKSVYQKLEVALAKKLNFLVDKKAEPGEIGSVANALQLTPPVNNYSDIENRKQVGVMLYTRANYTSQTDPATGWRRSIYLKTGSEVSIMDQIIGNGKGEIKPAFSDIYFDGKDYVFVYTDKKTDKGWKLYSGKNGMSLDRFRGVRGKDKYEWKVESIDVVKNILDKVFTKFDRNKSLFEQMRNGTELVKINEHTAWESLRFAIDLIQQIRNIGETERDNDFILSPVRDENGKHFDSREYWDKKQKNEKIKMPSSGDANGAFNIARKGMLMNAHIKTNSDSKDLNLFISDEEWDLYLANQEEWKNQLPKFSSRMAMEKGKIKKA